MANISQVKLPNNTTYDIMGKNVQCITWDDYQSLPSAAKNNSDIAYFITDIPASHRNDGVIKSVSGTAEASFSDGAEASLVECEIGIVPTQDLHGYSKPWAGGAGKNKLNVNINDYTTSGVTITNSNGVITLGNTATANVTINLRTDRINISDIGNTYKLVDDGSFTFSSDIYLNIRYYDSNASAISNQSMTSGKSMNLSVPSNAYSFMPMIIVKSGIATNGTVKPMLMIQTETDETFAPYSNICPISGHTDITVTVASTSGGSGEDYTVSLGSTYYGGNLNVTTGELEVTWGNIASYAGETLPGEWLSSLDEYTELGTPTTGAQVVYELDTPQTFTLTPTQVKTLLGQNYVSHDGGGTISLVYIIDSDVQLRMNDKVVSNGTIAGYALSPPNIDGGGSTGTVTSVAIANGGGVSVSGSPITSSGTITISHADTSSQASVDNSGRTYIQDITLDTYGHVTKITSATETVVNTDRYVNSAAFANDTSGVKMTLTRAGSDTATVTGTIPLVSSSTAGVAPKGTAVSSQSQSTKFLREDGSWAAPSYTTNTNTTYTLSVGTGDDASKIILTPSSGMANKITVPYATKATQDSDGNTIKSTYLKLSGGTMTGALTMAGTDIQLKTIGSSYDDSSDIVWYYGNGQEKARLWTQDAYTAKGGLNYRVYKKDGTSLYNGTIPLADGTGASGTWSITAAIANKLGSSNVGSATQPIYLSAGTATACTYTLGKSVPSNAVFTDTNTTYTLSADTTNNKIKLTPSSGNAQSITVPYATSAGSISVSTISESGFYKIPFLKNNQFLQHENFECYFAPGTTSEIGTSRIRLGNDMASGTEGNSGGMLELCSSGGKGWSMLTLAETDGYPSHVLPAQSGTIGVFTATPTSGQVVVTDGTAGGFKTTGYTLGKSVPSNAVFTDTTYTLGTNSNTVTLTPSSGSAQSITVPFATSATTASKATAANLTTTQYGIAYYTNTTGTFGNNPCLITTSTGGLEVKGMIAGDSGSTGHGLYGGGGYHNAYNNILLHGDASTGSSGIAFVSDKITASTGAVTNVNQPSDRAFIQYHACGITTATAEGTNPTLATSGETGRLVIGIGNDATDQIWLQTPSRTGLIHQVGAASYVIPDTNNTTGSVGSATNPVYVADGIIKGCTYSLNKTVPSDAVFTDHYAWSDITGKPSSFTPASHTHGNIQNGGTLQTNDITIASGDKLVVTDSSDSNKVARTSISFDGSTTTKCLTQKGTWATFGTSNLTLGTTASTALKGDTKYAGASTAGGSATSAAKLDTSTAGSATQPCYFANGVPSACTYSLNKTVPSDAVFTDSHVTTTLDSSSNHNYNILLEPLGDGSPRVTNYLEFNPSTRNLNLTGYITLNGYNRTSSTDPCPSIVLKANNIDTDTAVTARTYGNSEINVHDMHGDRLGFVNWFKDADGSIGFAMSAQNKSAGGGNYYNTLEMRVDKTGNRAYSISDAKAFRTAINTTTCSFTKSISSLAGATIVRRGNVVTLEFGHQITKAGSYTNIGTVSPAPIETLHFVVNCGSSWQLARINTAGVVSFNSALSVAANAYLIGSCTYITAD